VIGQLNGIATWAVMLFVWVAGLELDLRRAGSRRRETGVTAALVMAVASTMLTIPMVSPLLKRHPAVVFKGDR
jgi:Kef-type K+ transport system membrane component KefB